MTAKEKAKELVDDMDTAADEGSTRIAKGCALICVDELIKYASKDHGVWKFQYGRNYWQKVKNEIEKL